MKLRLSFALLLVSYSSLLYAQDDSLMFRKIANNIMLHGTCYDDLRVLCKQVGHRLSGSSQAEKAVVWGEKALTDAGADKVWLQPVIVPNWVRGKESLKIKIKGSKYWENITMLSLGNAIGTDGKPLEASIIMVKSFDEFKALPKEEVKGKIVFFNHEWPQELINTFEGYGADGPYRWSSPSMASAKGAVGIIIRSISTGKDDFPHTGTLHYADSIKPIPAVAIGNISADKLETLCNKETVRAQIIANCKMEGTKNSFNVIGEIKGSEYPDQFIVAGGHLDSWDVGEGANDDGSGCVQSIEIIRTFKALGIRPKRTIRVVLFMNEENGAKGGQAYNDSAIAHKERHILALESDAGSFSPRGIGLDMPSDKKEFIRKYRKLFLPYGVYDFEHDEGGTDIFFMHKSGVPAAGLMPDSQRYFDVHHTNNDVFENVNYRELKLGAIAMTQFVYLISQYGLGK